MPVSPRPDSRTGALYLGVDGGQSGTRCALVGADGVIRGTGTGRRVPFVLAPGGREALAASLEQAIRQATGQEVPPIRAAFLGLSGVIAGGRLEAVVREVASALLPGTSIFVDNDGLAAWAGALGLRPGVIAVCGSGSVVVGVDARGRTERAGGWGYLFGDEPGAFGLAREAIRLALQQLDAGAPSPLGQTIADHFGLSLEAVPKAFYAGEIDREFLATLAPVLAGLAEEGQPDASGLFRAAARLLAAQIARVAGRLEFGDGPVAWSPIGGVFRAAVFLDHVVEALREAAPRSFELVQPLYAPEVGAALLAAQRVGDPVPRADRR